MVMTSGFPAAYEGSGSYYERTVPYLRYSNWELRPNNEAPFSRDLIFGSGPLQSAIVTSPSVEYSQQGAPATSHEKVLSIVSFFGLSKSQLAKVFGVSRPTLYSWIDSSAEPQPDNLERINHLFSVVAKVSQSPNDRLFHEYVTEVLPGESNSLLEALATPVIDQQRAVQLARSVLGLTESRTVRLNNPGVPIATRDDTLVDNLTDIGTLG